ncbi:KpsF/GutQ family sugar-phosphate isomerase [bacterium]|nr:KpsF/GutQ family sugar-phosphate isomerase [bacterium]
MTKKEIIQTGQSVLEIEAQSIQDLSTQLDENFARAVESISGTQSRVIITGIGKSGLVGRKIASTLTSCGTPSIFIHPAEAGHGDLGMILKEDIVIVISYSGETKEIVDILNFIQRIGIQLISITGNKYSKLAKCSDIVVETRVEREAGPNGLIPTSSSTATLAMGDALAIALMKKKGFGEEDFASVHPKGQAGKKLLKVKNLMRKGQNIPAIHEETCMEDVLQEMSGKKMGMTCILDSDQNLIGIITDGDLRRMLQKYGGQILRKSARECMTPSPITIEKDDLATKALHLMEENKITSLIIQNKSGKIEGIIHLHDLWGTEMF